MRQRREQGTALVEVAIFLPLAILLFGLGSFVARAVIDYSRLGDLSTAAARYASRAAQDPARSEYRLRPTAEEVEAYVRRIATVPVEEVTVTPDPSTARPGDAITVTIRTRVSLGPVGRAVNNVAGVFTGIAGAGPPLPDAGIAIESTTIVREE